MGMSDSASSSNSSGTLFKILNIVAIVFIAYFGFMTLFCFIGLCSDSFRTYVSENIPVTIYVTSTGVQATTPWDIFLNRFIVFAILLVITILIKKFVLDKKSSGAAEPSA